MPSTEVDIVDDEGWARVLVEAAGHPELHDRWIRGLAYNKAASTAVIRRIIPVRDRLPYPTLWLTDLDASAETFADLARHPDVEVRADIAENTNTDAESLAVLAGDASPRVRRIAVIMASDRGLTFRAHLVRQLLADPDPKVQSCARSLESRLRGAASTPAEPAPATEVPVPATEPDLPTAEAAALVASPDRGVRAEAAWNPRVPRSIALGLADDPDDTVRLRLSLREDLSDEQRQAIAYIVRDGYHTVPAWIKALEGDPEALTRLAASPHVLIRRSVAKFEHLPAEAVTRLADDEDFFVKLTLCQNCAEAPHELVIEMYAWWHGKTWWFLQFHPNFARPGFAKYSTHVNMRLRMLSLRDPELSVPEVVRLTADPEVGVWALRDARVPTANLQAALLESTWALAVAANPRLPEAVMHALLDLAGVAQA
jgi:hypothetical protein